MWEGLFETASCDYERSFKDAYRCLGDRARLDEVLKTPVKHCPMLERDENACRKCTLPAHEVNPFKGRVAEVDAYLENEDLIVDIDELFRRWKLGGVDVNGIGTDEYTALSHAQRQDELFRADVQGNRIAAVIARLFAAK